MNRLYVIEGADGTGKSTLSKELLEETKGHLLHGTYDKEWDIPSYHRSMFNAALQLLQYQDVILDRWAVSEEVYSNAFRNGAKYSADQWMLEQLESEGMKPEDVTFIYCENDNAVENHQANKEIRTEMFEDMSPVVREYTAYMGRTALNWVRYDFTKVDMHQFVKDIAKDEK